MATTATLLLIARKDVIFSSPGQRAQAGGRVRPCHSVTEHDAFQTAAGFLRVNLAPDRSALTCRGDRHARRKAQNARVDMEREAVGNRRQGQHGENDRHAPCGEGEADDTAEDGQKRAFDQVLEDQGRPARAERGAQRQLAPPRGVSEHEQVADVRAGRKQYDRDERHQRQERAPVLAAQLREPFARWQQLRLHGLIRREWARNRSIRC